MPWPAEEPWPHGEGAHLDSGFRQSPEAPAGSVLHGAAEIGVTMKGIAETIARSLELPTVSPTP